MWSCSSWRRSLWCSRLIIASTSTWSTVCIGSAWASTLLRHCSRITWNLWSNVLRNRLIYIRPSSWGSGRTCRWATWSSIIISAWFSSRFCSSRLRANWLSGIVRWISHPSIVLSNWILLRSSASLVWSCYAASSRCIIGIASTN